MRPARLREAAVRRVLEATTPEGEVEVGAARHRVLREPTEGGAETSGGRAKAPDVNDA